jgi:hypothetical protein
MSRTPRSTLIRKAHSLPKGSEERREILAAVSQTWGRRLNELKFDFMQEVVNKAIDILRDEGIRAKSDVRGVVGEVKGEVNGEPVSIHYQWDDGFSTIKSTMAMGHNSRTHKNKVLSLSPDNVASESIYKHFGGLID